MKKEKPRYHPLAFLAFLLALFVLVAPLQADIVFAALHFGKTLDAILAVVGSITIVALPLLIAQRSTTRNPEKWKPRFLTKLTWGIIIVNVTFNVMILLNIQMNKQASEQSPGAYPNRAADGPLGNAQE